MVTIDNTIRNVKDFDGDLAAGRKDYERAKQGLEVVKGDMAMFEEMLKLNTGFDSLNLPTKPETTVIQEGDVTFEINSITRIKRPKYKEAVSGMENYLNGISFLMAQGKAITGIVKEGRSTFIEAEKLLEAYSVIVGGIMDPEVKHTIKYEAGGALADEGQLEELVLDEKRMPGMSTPENAANYVRMDRLKDDLSSYVKAYEKELAKGQGAGKKTKAVTSKAAYQVEKGASNGVDWAYVVTTLVSVPTQPGKMGELNILADEAISKAQKERDMPGYKLMYREPDGERKLYVSIQSVYERIAQLKGDESITAEKLTVRPKEIV